MKSHKLLVVFLLAVCCLALIASEKRTPETAKLSPIDKANAKNAVNTFDQGRQVFRFSTFDDQAFWGDTLRLHEAIEGAKLGGVGPGLSPKAALAAGLKVDVDALPSQLIEQLKRGEVNLDDPAVTLALLKLNSVLGVTGYFKPDGSLRSAGIQCALCHSTVDNSLAPGLGRRLDGWANRDLNVGGIISLAPNLQPFADLLGVDQATVRKVLQSWGPGRFDAELALDGKAFRPDGKTSAVLIPPAFGLAGVNLHTWTGWGSVTYWNAFVANLEMHGKGNFFDPRLDNAKQFPVAARAGFGHVKNAIDEITPKLAGLHAYQMSLTAPKAPAGSFDAASAKRGKAVFQGAARCAECHVAPLYTEPGWNSHTGAEIGIDDFAASRSPDGRYRTTPLQGLGAARSKGGYYHDGRFATLQDVVQHYDQTFALGLAPTQKADLVQFLKSL